MIRTKDKFWGKKGFVGLYSEKVFGFPIVMLSLCKKLKTLSMALRIFVLQIHSDKNWEKLLEKKVCKIGHSEKVFGFLNWYVFFRAKSWSLSTACHGVARIKCRPTINDYRNILKKGLLDWIVKRYLGFCAKIWSPLLSMAALPESNAGQHFDYSSIDCISMDWTEWKGIWVSQCKNSKPLLSMALAWHCQNQL